MSRRSYRDVGGTHSLLVFMFRLVALFLGSFVSSTSTLMGPFDVVRDSEFEVAYDPSMGPLDVCNVALSALTL